MLFALYLLAQAEAPAQEGGAFLGGMNWLTLGLIAVLFYIMLIRPGQRQEKERKAQIAALKKGDRVIAAGGLLGTVYALKDNADEVTLKVAEGRVEVLRSSIMRVLRDEEVKTEAKAEARS